MIRTVVLALVIAAMPVACSTEARTGSTGPARSNWPSSIVALGQSGVTGYNSDSARPGQDALDNSWATGSNPIVNSIYLRELALHPAVKGHNFNVATDGSDVEDLPRQVDMALAETPLPDLFVIQSVHNDVRCDGTDAQNYVPYAQKLQAVLASIFKGSPTAQIWIIGTPVNEKSYADVTKNMPDVVAQNSGGGPCDVFDKTGNVLPEKIAYLEDVENHYNTQLQSTCGAFPNCHYDGGATENMTVVAADLGSDGAHPSVQGDAKLADLAWTAFTR